MAKRTRPIEGVQRRYSWRLYLTYDQYVALKEQAGMCADLWNALLSICEERYRRAIQKDGPSVTFHCPKCAALSDEKGRISLCEEHKLPSEFDMGNWISQMRAECPEWQTLSTWTPRQVSTSLSAAWQAFFRRVKNGEEAGYPRYKSRMRAVSVPHRFVSGCKLVKSDRHENSWLLQLKGVPGNVWARGALPGKVNEWTNADIYLGGKFGEVSAAVVIEPRRIPYPVTQAITVRFDLVDGFIVNNDKIVLQDITRAKLLDDQHTRMQAEFDKKWVRNKKWTDDQWKERNKERAVIDYFKSRIARIRKNALHVWTSHLASQASMMTIIKPKIKENTRTPKGNDKDWGAEVETVSALNRSILSYAPAMAIAMLKYKAEELGVKCVIIDDPTPDPIGRELVAARKSVRGAQRALKKETEHGTSGKKPRTKGSPRHGS